MGAARALKIASRLHDGKDHDEVVNRGGAPAGKRIRPRRHRDDDAASRRDMAKNSDDELKDATRLHALRCLCMHVHAASRREFLNLHVDNDSRGITPRVFFADFINAWQRFIKKKDEENDDHAACRF